MAQIVDEFEQKLNVLTIRPFDDGRFIVRLGGKTIFDKDRTGAFPRFEQDIRPRLVDV